MAHTNLSDISLPGRFRCTNVDCTGDAAVQLKRLGVCDGRSIEVMQPGDPMVLRVVGARIGVSRLLASSVRVEPNLDSGAAGVDVRTGDSEVRGLTGGFVESKVADHV